MLPARPTRAGVLVLLAGLLGALSPVTAAHAADRAVAGGRLDWGLKSSFQRYVTGPIAQGSWSLRQGAATVGESQFRFHSAKGSYDPDSGSFSAAFSGGVHFVGHRKPSGTYELDLSLSRLTVRTSGNGTGTLYADMVSRAKGTGKVTSASQVPLASLDLSRVNMRGGGTAVVLQSIPATLTARGAQAFAGYYTAGTPLDPLNLSADIAPGATDDKGDSGDKGGKPGQDKPEDGAKSGDKDGDKPKTGDEADRAGGAARIEDAAVDWGVRRTFREYVTGPIAKGRWKLTDGARDGGALFRFPAGKGDYDRRTGALDATFTGRTHFTGARLDLALSGVRVKVADGRGTLAADVTTDGATRRGVPLVTFDATALKAPKAKDGLVTVAEAPTRLTRQGAEAFGGMYRAGTAMDPLSLAVATDADATLPPLPDLGSEPTATPSPEPSATAVAAPADSDGGQAADDSDGPSTPALVTGGAALLAAVAAATVLVVRKRRTAEATTPTDTDGAPAGG
ncbi:HtaA domain-containing protein [Streptomyces sp. 71268]|uniref:HtaA domain-containing protein n=1 Tax=Streptomyces sp. 71268 TaxID=3002640 RepID=UPI0023F70DE1|nr:HtaA domain-containing protein [Streptomyces sp. 71268]WEV28140.1 HtaA domain-containing protein [Streptomyces sp. 71268]